MYCGKFDPNREVCTLKATMTLTDYKSLFIYTHLYLQALIQVPSVTIQWNPGSFYWILVPFHFTIFDQNKPFSYTYISTTATPIDMIQGAVYLGYLVLNSSHFYRLSHEVFVKHPKPHYFHFFLHGAGHEIQISYSCQRCI